MRVPVTNKGAIVTIKQQESSRKLALPGLLAASVIVMMSLGSPAHAQEVASSSTSAPETRAQVKMDLAEFRRTHTWNPASETWTLKPGIEPPEGGKSRAQVKAERDDFLSKNKWSEVTETWIPREGAPRNLSTRTRAQIKAETAQFMRTHRWDEETENWVDKPVPAKKSKSSS